jgi:glutamyl-tRNA reductase
MAIVLTGLSHKSAPVEVRECLALSKDRVGGAPGIGAFREELQSIARCEFAKSRKRLGLTPEQERAVEAMLVVAANKIAHPAIQVMRRTQDLAREREARPEREVSSEFGLTPAAGLLAAA